MADERRTHSRIRLLTYACIAIMVIFVGRLFQLQVLDHNKYVALANQEQLKRLTIPAKRGELYMMDNGTPAKVVLNQTVYTMFVDPEVVDEPGKVIQTIREIVGGNAEDGFVSMVTKENTRYQIVARQVTHRQAELVRERGLKGVGFQAESKRVYPEKTLAAQTFGFVNNEGKGQYGIEGKFDEDLEGKDGLLQSVTDVANVPLTIGRDNIDIPAKNGRDIVLTLDRNIQSYTEQALASGMKKSGATNGSAIVLDPNTGKVMAMVSLPTYDPSKISSIPSFEAVNNGSVSTPYEPGSVIKTFTMATGIDTGTVQPDSTFVNTDSVRVGDRTIGNATKGQTGTITMQHALNWSLNTGMVTVAERLGNGSIDTKARSTMYDYFYNKFRLGQKTGIELSSEAEGNIIPPTDPLGNAVQYATMSFGQGMDLTMVQVASAFGAMVNGGTYHPPTVIEGEMNDDQLKQAEKKASIPGIIKPETSAKMRTMTTTARHSFDPKLDRKGYMVGGKTGTSQTLINGSYDNGQTIGTYIGFGGDSKPRYVIMVQVSGKGENLAGGQDAMPIFTDISDWMIDYLKLQPKR